MPLNSWQVVQTFIQIAKCLAINVKTAQVYAKVMDEKKQKTKTS